MTVLRTGLLGRALLVASLAVPAAAQTPPPATPAAQQAPDKNAASLKQAIDQRIAALKAKLAITDAQGPAWEVFAGAMRDNADSTNALFTQRAQSAATMSAVDNMKSYATLARAYADNMDKLADAFGKLYAGLSPEQQKTADVLFRAPPAAPRRR
jgi:hypothetical protein